MRGYAVSGWETNCQVNHEKAMSYLRAAVGAANVGDARERKRMMEAAAGYAREWAYSIEGAIPHPPKPRKKRPT